MAKKKIIFELKNVDVEFEKHAIGRKSLRESLGIMLNPEPKEKTIALKGINITIYEGEHIGIIGRNGAGKSTLLRTLTKVIIPTYGEVRRDEGKHIVPLLELGIGFQGDLSGRENCYLAGILIGYTKDEIDEKIESIISFSELGSFIDEPVKNYSSGMYARLAFAIATDINPEVLIIDEVFGVGDEFFMRKCNARMHNLIQSGITTVFVTHDLDFLLTQCNRLIWLEKGQIKMDGNCDEVAQAYRAADSNLRLLKAQ
jgi:ABC-type polysaccharide/polyol phosphate transport system ATPase subunit